MYFPVKYDPFREVDRATATLLAVPAKTNNGNALFKNKFRVRAYYESMPGFAKFYSKHGMSPVYLAQSITYLMNFWNTI